MRSLISSVALALLSIPASARVVWIPEDFDPLTGIDDNNRLLRRDSGTCGGDTSLTYCGGGMPSGFCCSSGYNCLVINTQASVTAAMCCPAGETCAVINPISCDTSLQNVTITQLHADPPQKLKTCGTACCPMGYSCQNARCVANTAPTTPSSTSTSSSGAPAATTSSTSTATRSSATTTSAPTAAGSTPLGQSEPLSKSSSFSGKSFAAGFVPGIALGALIAAIIILLVLRRRRNSASSSYVNEKGNVRDTLTDLGPLERRPTMHGRNISEPKADPSAGHRTDFLRGSPPRAVDANGVITNGYVVDVRSPAYGPNTPSTSPPRVKALFSRSPFMAQYPSTPPSTQAPIPAHLKRGTLSFKISPVRALKKQKSMHSLRRQMTDGSAGNSDNSRSNSRRKMRPDHSRSESTETIQVLMPSNEPYTPEQIAQMPEHIQTLASTRYQPSSSTSSEWTASDSTSDSSPDAARGDGTTYASSSRYPSDVQGAYTTPTRPPVPRLPTGNEAFLASPYTPTNNIGNGKGKGAAGGSGGLTVNHDASRRDTTFSAMMEKAGLRKSDLLMGGGSSKAR